MSQSSDSSSRALATLVTALGITIGATPATLHAQAPANVPMREAVQSKHAPEAVQGKQKAAEAVQNKVGTKEALQNKVKAKAQADGDDDDPPVQAKGAVQQKDKAAVQNKVGVPAKAPAAAPAKPF
jgi:hypothetical protein